MSFDKIAAGLPDDCYFCGLPGATHYVEEWDCMIHSHCVVRCIASYLKTEEEEGQVKTLKLTLRRINAPLSR